jgi:DNA-binding response OmpR family regulator
MNSSLILLIEGKSTGNVSLVPALEKAGYLVHHVTTGQAAYQWVCTESQTPHLIIFDASTLRSNGVRNCRRLKKCLPGTPIIYARSTDQTLDSGLEVDVHLIRPFTFRKVLNRVRTLLPPDVSVEQIVRYGEITLYVDRCALDMNGRGEKHITPKLMRLLEEFLRYPNVLISREQLMQNVWQTDYLGDTRTLDVHIRWARELIEENPSTPRLLMTVRGKGYKLQMNDMA